MEAEKTKIVRVTNEVYQLLAREYPDPNKLGHVAVVLGCLVGMAEAQAADRRLFREKVLQNANDQVLVNRSGHEYPVRH